MNVKNKNFLVVVLTIIALWMVINLLMGGDAADKGQSLPYSTFMSQVNSNQIQSVTLKGDVIVGKNLSGVPFYTQLPSNVGVANQLVEKGVQVEAANQTKEYSLLDILISWFPMLLIIGFWIFIYRQMQSGSGRAMGFGRSRAQILDQKKKRVTFNDVAGIEEAKYEVEEVVEFLKDPQKFQRLGGKIPRGVLLVGPPGTGKTLLARAIAGEAKVPFFSISGSDFVEMFVGVGASRVRDMFEQGKKNAPCIIFIDEIDAVGRHRGAGLGGGNDEREQTLNQLLVEMDGFSDNEGVILVAATNRPDVLDPALLRPGRFDRQVVVPNPDIKGREQILEVHLKKVPQAEEVNPRIIARGTPGFSGADLANLVNEAALLAARRGRRVVGMHELEEAKDKVMMGSERRSMVMTDAEKKLTAYHEAGHALVAKHLPDSDPIHKATIIPRGRALGMVIRLPENDRISMSRDRLKADLAVAMGGRIAEHMIFGEGKVTTGAASDIKMATDIARRMVTEWGMSAKLGPLTYGEPQQEVFLGHSVTQTRHVSEQTFKIIDEEVRRIIDEAYAKANAILTKHLDQLHSIAQALIEYETLSGEEISILLKGESLDKKEAVVPRKTRRKRASIPLDTEETKGRQLNPEPQPGI